MTRESAKLNAQARAAFTDKFGSCAIESGIVGNLADNECKHGNLASDPRRCACFPKRKMKR